MIDDKAMQLAVDEVTAAREDREAEERDFSSEPLNHDKLDSMITYIRERRPGEFIFAHPEDRPMIREIERRVAAIRAHLELCELWLSVLRVEE